MAFLTNPLVYSVFRPLNAFKNMNISPKNLPFYTYKILKTNQIRIISYIPV